MFRNIYVIRDFNKQLIRYIEIKLVIRRFVSGIRKLVAVL